MKGLSPAAAALLLALPLGVAAACAGAAEKDVFPFEKVELADEPDERARGLMGRQDLCSGCAMLFVWPEEEVRSFWMKNTPLSLDIIFMDGKGRIVAIHEDTEPYRESPSYHSPRPARFVLETRGGFARRHGIEEGDTVDLARLFRIAEPYRWPAD